MSTTCDAHKKKVRVELLYNSVHSKFNQSTVKGIFWYSSTGCTYYLHRCISYFDSPAESKVNI